MIRTQEEHLAHIGILRRSGRYPWGSGGTQNVRNRSFLDIIEEHRKEGLSETEIAKLHGITTTQLRAAKSMASAQQKQQKILTAQRLKDRGWSNTAIGQRMGIPESSVRNYTAAGAMDKALINQTTANMLKKQVDEKKYIDVGLGVEHHIGVTESHLKNSIAILKEQGYEVHTIHIPQVTDPKKFTKMKVLAKPGTTEKEVNQNRAQIKQITEYSEDKGRSFFDIQPPISVSSKRLAVNYLEDGGHKLDGVIYVRPGVKDLSIGSNRYGQVRIAIDGTHYLKGMAIYKEDLPDGVDLVLNTNKSKTVGWKTDKNKISNDPDNPFGAIIRQHHDPNTGKVNSAINMVGSPTKPGSGEEGQWDTWSRSLSSQMLSKQSPKLAQQQLDLTYERRRKEFDEISSLTNPTVRKELLIRFADQTDSAAVHLAAASLPRQATKVLLPLSKIKPTEIYAPTFRDGERVVLIRHPHAGTFEIPELTVNNKNPEGRKIIGPRAKDAVGIHHEVAQHLSGADFDGDTVLVIPNNSKRNKVTTTNALARLKDFDTMSYKLPDDSPIPRISKSRKETEMGKISNLITDMTIRGANTEELARAVRHSMVVIDSEKHGLNFKQSEEDNGILSLKEEYQFGKRRGASTLISLAGSEARIPERRLRSAARGGPIDPKTGRKVYEETGRTYKETKLKTDPNTGRKVRVETGRSFPKIDIVDKMAITDDAHSLIRPPGTRMENIYADHANKLKAMANAARKESVHTKPQKYSPLAKKAYASEVASLNSKLKIALRNAPLERQAQLLANTQISQVKRANPGMEKEEITKVRQIALNKARNRTGANKHKVTIEQNEWNAIQAGAISTNTLGKILKNSDIDSVKRLAMPKTAIKMSSTKMQRAQSMLDSGYTQAEVADALGVGLTTLKVALNE